MNQILGERIRVLRLLEFEKVRTVGIIFDASDEIKYKLAARLIGYLKSQGKNLMAVGYVSSKVLPHYADSTLSNNYILKKDISWFNFPKAIFINDFINMEFDLLIDLNFENIPGLYSLTKYSLAHCKIGLNQGVDNDIYDFMLEGIHRQDINLFLKELIKYLEMIRTK